MHVNFIVGESHDKIREACYDYLIAKYGGVVRDRHLSTGIDRRASENRVFDRLSDQGRNEKSRDD